MDDILVILPNETEEDVLIRIAEAKRNGLLDLNWQQIADWLNLRFREDEGHYFSESAYRKRAKAYFDAKERYEQKWAGNEEYAVLKRSLEKEKIKIQTERLEYNRWLREDARDELIAEHISQAIKELPPLEIPASIGPVYRDNHRAGTLLIADPHYGTELEIRGLYGEVLNKYNPEIFEERMWNLFNQVTSIVSKEGFTDLNVYDLGDNIAGMLRVSQLMKLRYGVIESAVRYSRFMTEWLNALTEYVHIHFQMVRDSNHNQLRLLGQPKNTFKDENVSIIIAEKFMDRLRDNPNFEFVQNPTGLIFQRTLGYNILGCHGEEKRLSQAIKDFSQTYKVSIDFLVGGHNHHGAYEEVGINSDVISAPSIIGIDDYSLSLHKTSSPGATLFVLEEGQGKNMEYNIKL